MKCNFHIRCVGVVGGGAGEVGVGRWWKKRIIKHAGMACVV